MDNDEERKQCEELNRLMSYKPCDYWSELEGNEKPAVVKATAVKDPPIVPMEGNKYWEPYENSTQLRKEGHFTGEIPD